MHDLQEAFATEAGEAAWAQAMRALFNAGAFDEAEALLAEALAALDSELAWTCLELPREAVVLSGWDELSDAIALHEGDAVTGVTIAIANEADGALAKGSLHRPYVVLGIYTDAAYRFSAAGPRALLEECHADLPGWAGREEDIEVHMALDGLDTLNTRLVQHTQQQIARNGAMAPAPMRYVEFVLGSWWRALRWHQAVATECALRGLPRGISVVAGMVDLRPDVVAVHASRGPDSIGHRPRSVFRSDGPPLAGQMVTGVASSLAHGFIRRKPIGGLPETPVAPLPMPDWRRRAHNDDEPQERPQRSLWARIFGSRRSR